MILSANTQGFIINEGSTEKISERLMAVLKKIVSFSKTELGDNFLSAYVRGSVSVGRFIDKISDIDFVVVSKLEPNSENFNNFLDYSLELDKEYFWVKGFDLFLVSEDNLFNSKDLNKLRIYLTTQSVLFEGEDIVKKLKEYKPDQELTSVLLSEIDDEFLFLKNIFSSVQQDYSYNNQIRSLDFWCVWMSRVVLRFSLYASLNQHHSYTNDLRDCYKIVSEIYPELEPDLKLALTWSQSPINNQVILGTYLDRVVHEIKNIFTMNNK